MKLPIISRCALLTAVLLLCAPCWAVTRNILLTGYWPPTNEMLHRWSTNRALNPTGWIGRNWEGRGYDIYSYFPTFRGAIPPNYGRGEGDFQVDYQDASEDFWRITGELDPVAIITFSRGTYPQANWEIEARHRKLPLNQWAPDYLATLRPTSELPFAQEPDNFIRHSSLPMAQIEAAINAASLPFGAFIDNFLFAGNFVSEFTGYHGTWYQNLHDDPADPAWCIAAGHIHVGISTPLVPALTATEITLRELTAYLNTRIPEPATGAMMLVTLAAAGGWRVRNARVS